MKEIRTDDLPLIGKGVSGSVYRFGEDKALKLFKSSFTQEQVKRAYEVACFIDESGIATAKPYEMVRSGDSFGIVSEYLDSPTLLSLIRDGKISRQDAAGRMGEILRRVHALSAAGQIQTQREMVGGILERCGQYLTDGEITKLLALTGNYPGKHVLHGDFHENNILVRGDEYLLIDLDSVNVGSPLFEMGQLFCIYKTGIPKGLHLSVSDGCRFLRTLLGTYFETDDAGLLETYEEIFTEASYFNVFFSMILRTPEGEEENCREKVREELPRLTERLERLEERFGILPW